MVAAPVPVRPAPRLLFEPDPPLFIPGRRYGKHFGWHTRDGIKRNREHDAWGSVVQEIVLRYTLHGVLRKDLAREYGICERQVQMYVMGQAYRYYTAPVFRALARLGLEPGRLSNRKRRRGIEAFGVLARDVLTLLEHDARPLAREVVASLRLLAEEGASDGR